VEIYSSRRVAKQSDSLNAFQGILSDLASQYELGCCWGLPTSYFHVVLGWQVWASESRESGDRVDDIAIEGYRKARYGWHYVPHHPQDGACFPRWSWASSDYFWIYGNLKLAEWNCLVVSG
jgi:hypothetical protein